MSKYTSHKEVFIAEKLAAHWRDKAERLQMILDEQGIEQKVSLQQRVNSLEKQLAHTEALLKVLGICPWMSVEKLRSDIEFAKTSTGVSHK